MDKLQWFKFSPMDWTMGKISRLPYSMQGEFARFCCVYWNRQCTVTKEDAELEFTDKTFQRLVQTKILKIDGKNLRISFLDSQMNDIDKIRVQASKAGKASAKIRKNINTRSTEFNDRSTTVQQNPTDIDKDIDKDKEKNKSNNIHRQFEHLFITLKNYEKLCSEWNKNDVDAILDSIENYKSITNYKSLYLTARSWLRDRPRIKNNGAGDNFTKNVMKQIKK